MAAGLKKDQAVWFIACVPGGEGRLEVIPGVVHQDWSEGQDWVRVQREHQYGEKRVRTVDFCFRDDVYLNERACLVEAANRCEKNSRKWQEWASDLMEKASKVDFMKIPPASEG